MRKHYKLTALVDGKVFIAGTDDAEAALELIECAQKEADVHFQVTSHESPRFREAFVAPQYDEWTDWAEKAEHNPILEGFLRCRPF